MDRIRRTDLQALLDSQPGPCVSLFMPMHVEDRNAQEDPVRLRKLADQAQCELIDRGMRRTEAEALLRPVRDLPNDNETWQHRGRAFACFAASGMQRMFHISGAIEPSVHVNDHFYVLPLIPFVTDAEKFFVLALSQNAIRFFEGDAAELREVHIPGLPKNLADAVKIEDIDRGEQVHSSASLQSAGRGELGKQAGVFHGHGGKPELIKDAMREYLSRVAPILDKRLNDEHAPLVLATVEATVPMWNDASRYKFLIDEFVAGNPDHLSAAALHEKAWPLVQPALSSFRKLCERRLLDAEGAKVASSLRDIVPAAISGRIAALFIDCRRRRWGQYDATNHAVVLHSQRESGDRDLVELAAIETMKNGGDVFDLRPEEAGAAEPAQALLRF